ncbi:ROK family protein [Devosia algicola]|uniref:ROK family protein n=1 Tax=Devosia algicola TaxID=3026418 RepID=A0ABY7YM74_9HYPH|nr:ROK family protein [Devosia algicola]WDR02399.1 ROK family protein [Devosia algicola]
MSVCGVDIGGTNVRLVVLDEGGGTLAHRRLGTSPERGAEQTIDAIIVAIENLVAHAGATPLQAIGVGITGPVDVVTGVVSNPFTLEGWPPTDLREPFASAFGVPVTIDNDANVAAVGEWWRGAGMGARRMTMVTIGTGIGVATLIDGYVQRTSSGRHGEAGHMALNPAGPECYCGARGCWEVLGSGTALGRHARALAKHEDGTLRAMANGDPEQATSALLFAAAAAGDNAARAVIDNVANWLGLGLVNLASTVMPDVFVLSGGVMEHFETIHPRIEQVLRQHSVMIPTAIPVVVAALDDEAGAVGAAKMALDLIGQSAR